MKFRNSSAPWLAIIQFVAIFGICQAHWATRELCATTLRCPVVEDENEILNSGEQSEDKKKKRPEKFSKPTIIEFKGEISTGLTRYFNNRFEQARQSGADLLIIEIDSPGGLKFQSLEMARELQKCDWAYTIALIPKEAISGGALVALGCDEIFVAPDATMGNIGEIAFDPEENAFRLIRSKVESSLSHDIRQLAKAKGRSEDLVEAFVDKDVLVYSKPKDRGEGFDFKQARVGDANQPKPPWELIPETRPERFMNLSGERALELGLADFMVVDRTELAKSLGFDSDSYRIYSYTTTDTLVHLLNNPLITGLLILVGLIAIYFEFSAPGIGIGGLIAGLCMLLFFWSRYLGGTAGWLEIILFGAGMTFMLMELFVIPGFGVAGLTGLILLFSSIVLASQNFTLPSNTQEWNQSFNSIATLLVSMVLFSIAAVFISKYFGSIPLLNRLVLEPPTMPESDIGKTESGKPVPVAHPHVSVGDWGTSESLLRPAGRARFAGRSFDVISDGSFVEPGTQVKVIRIQGNIITVAKVVDG